MPAEFYFYLVAGAIAGGLVTGLAGFGTALFALGFWLQVMPPVQAVAVVLLIAVVGCIQGLWVVKKSVNRPRLVRFCGPAILGVPVGLAVLQALDASILKLVIAGFLLLYGGYFLLRKELPRFERRTPITDATIGFLGGVLGGAAGLAGVLPTMWVALHPWPKEEQRALLQPFNALIMSIAAVLLALNGAYTRETLYFAMLAMPVAILSTQAGIFLYRKLGDDQFRMLLIGLLLVSGGALLAQELLAAVRP
ncbi:MAG: sulfite exporter TauE/SafE family protein [Alphaproteobacteria bacterium]|nr:sulfite exporter TauE/SafE family protein [Alphaproteobacteria bacterium]